MQPTKSKVIKLNDDLFKKRLSDALKAQGIKQKELANKIGVLPMTVNRWLKNPITAPFKREHLMNICNVLGLEQDYFTKENYIPEAKLQKIIDKAVNEAYQREKPLLDYLSSIGIDFEPVCAGSFNDYVQIAYMTDKGTMSEDCFNRLKTKLKLKAFELFGE